MNVKGHAFWKSAVGSQLNFHIEIPPESQLSSLRVTYLATRPPTYRVQFFLSDGNTLTTYHSKKDTIRAIKYEWLHYYEDRTRVEFI